MKFSLSVHTALLTMPLIFAGNAWADQTSDFEAIVKKCKSSLTARPSIEVVQNEKQQVWTKRLYAPSTVTYDVLRTNSLITPFSGYIEVTETATSKKADNEDSARALSLSVDDPAEPVLRFITRIDYAFKAGVWAVSEVKRATVFKMPGHTSFENKEANTIRYGQDNLPKLYGPIAACIQNPA